MRRDDDRDDAPRPRRRRRDRHDEDDSRDRLRRDREDSNDNTYSQSEMWGGSSDAGDGRRLRDDEPQRSPFLSKNVIRGLIAGVVLLVLLVIVVFLLPRDKQGPFRAQMSDYVSLSPASGMGGPAPPIGRMVVVSVNDSELDDVHFALSYRARASGPGDVKVVVQVRWENVNVGRYNNGATAYQRIASVQGIDLATKRRVFAHSFSGTFPPEVVMVNKDRQPDFISGTDPRALIAKYLNSLIPG